MSVKVRFAPSPTGSLHIGGARTALFNWLYARHSNGKFLLRIEDTDRERSTKAFEESILAGMKWLGLDWDEEPLYQSSRLEIHQAHIQKLLDEGNAYYCTCSSELLEQKREAALKAGKKPVYDRTCRHKTEKPNVPAAVRFKAPETGVTTYKDICRGTIQFENKELDDLIIARSDGNPTYNFVVVVDDATMEITHVIRGDDHISNTPKQVLLYNALGYSLPAFAHLPMIHGSDKKKLSKRHGATSVIEYEAMGYLPEAMINYLARLGWSYKDQEIFSRDELVSHFSLESVGQSPSIFDTEKLAWVNSQHMAKLSIEELLEKVEPFLYQLGVKHIDREFALKALASEREKGRTLLDIAKSIYFYFTDSVIFDEEVAKEFLNAEAKAILHALHTELLSLESFSHDGIQSSFKNVMEKTQQKMGAIGKPCRVALVGSLVGPGIYDILEILGKRKSLLRLEEAIQKIVE